MDGSCTPGVRDHLGASAQIDLHAHFWTAKPSIRLKDNVSSHSPLHPSYDHPQAEAPTSRAANKYSRETLCPLAHLVKT